jgi:transcriptional regulator with XRE-family HTH domain
MQEDSVNVPAPKPWTDDPSARARAGRRLIEYRAAHGVERNQKRLPMTQEEFARRAGVSIGCIAGFEAGHRSTRAESLRRIAEACGLTVEQLFAPEPEPARGHVGVEEHLTDEAITIARIFALAHTEVRARVKAELLEHLAQRTDRPAVALRDALTSTGPEPVTRKEAQAPGNGTTGATFPERKNGSGK